MSFFSPEAQRAEARTFLGDPTYNPFERPSMPLASLALDGILGAGGSNDSGQDVTVEKGMALPTAYRCLAIVGTVVGSLTLEEIDKRTSDATDWDGFDDLASYTAFEIKEYIGTRIGGWGNFFGKMTKANGDTGKLLDLVPYPGGDVTVIKKRGQKIYRVRRRNDDGTVSMDPGKPNEVLYEDIPDGPGCPIMHIPGMGFDGLQGVSPIMLAAQTFGTTIAADKLAARFYSSGQQLGGIVKVKVPLAKQSQADAIRMAWKSKHAGVSNSGDVAVLDSETDFQPLTIAPEALQFLQSREWQATEVARMFGIPPHLVGELTKSTSWGAGIEQQNIGFVTYTMRGYTDRIEERLYRYLGRRGKRIEFDLDDMLRGSMMERFQAYGQGIGWGFMNANEARKKERMKPRPGGDQFLEPTAMNGALSDAPMAEGGAAKGAGAANSQVSNDKAAPTGQGDDNQKDKP